MRSIAWSALCPSRPSRRCPILPSSLYAMMPMATEAGVPVVVLDGEVAIRVSIGIPRKPLQCREVWCVRARLWSRYLEREEVGGRMPRLRRAGDRVAVACGGCPSASELADGFAGERTRDRARDDRADVVRPVRFCFQRGLRSGPARIWHAL